MSAEILVIFIVALIVFGPRQLPMLATHLGLMLKKIQHLKTQAAALWQQQLNELQLQENLHKAKAADEQYKKDESV